MADAPISEELTTLKKRARRRLVGAVALVLVALVVLWTVMDDKPPQSLASEPVAIVSTTPGLAGTVTPTPAPAPFPPLPQVEATKPAQQPMTPPVVETTPVTKPEPQVKPVAKPEAKPEAKPVEKKPESKPAEVHKDPARILAGMEEEADTAAKPKPATDTRFFLQLGAFADKDKALGLVAKARGTGVTVQTEAIKTDKGALTRLRAGPYDNRDAAEKAHAKLAGAGISSSIVGK
ncbi:SPOR domain-containing protein [Chitinimonas viridis]|uniref:SPOR domain-containing protein n=1 Tax=Chitinimonas viridis TaxID=664880 RepID=A0ABT8B5M4_9NEIS|nr:SPOR domain-containing protein [Chitinimonas viridis]MDN3577305.1 SPOR domain-containing protein [Chitinimonas viridis]